MKDLQFRELHFLIDLQHPSVATFRQMLDSMVPGLSSNLGRLAELDPDTSRKVLEFSLGAACECQNALNIELGRAVIISMPRSWVLENIEATAESLLDCHDEWSYRRLLELCWKLDRDLVHRLAVRATLDEDEEVKELGADCLSQLG